MQSSSYCVAVLMKGAPWKGEYIHSHLVIVSTIIVTVMVQNVSAHGGVINVNGILAGDVRIPCFVAAKTSEPQA